MTTPPHKISDDAREHIVIESAAHGGGRLAAALSVLALACSGYSLWDSSLKGPNLRAFVPPVIQYSSPYNNSNFEVVEVPVTLTNDGGRTGTVLSMDLEATNVKTNETKHFYSANFGHWTMDKARANGFDPFAPISLAGKVSRTETLLFYTNGPAEKPDQLIREPGVYKFKLSLDEAKVDDFGVFDRLTGSGPKQLTFAMELRDYDARAFQTGTLPLYSLTGRSAKSTDAAVP